MNRITRKLFNDSSRNLPHILDSIQTNSVLWDTGDLIPKEEFDKFVSFLPHVIDEVLETSPLARIPEVKQHFTKALYHVVPGGKKLRSCMVIAALKMFEDKGLLSSEDSHFRYKLGWLLEIAQGIIVTDDIIDGSETRRGRPSWHTVDDVGMKAVSDGFLMKRLGSEAAAKIYSHHPNYALVRDLFQNVGKTTLIGQILDSFVSKPRMELHKMENFRKIAKCKTAHYTFHCPLKYVLLTANINSEEVNKPLEKFCDEMGVFYQVQNDIWDAYAPTGLTGKEGTDIQEGKCTWLSVRAMQEGNDKQREIMKKYYGKNDPEAVAAIRNVYEDLDMKAAFKSYQKETFKKICGYVSEIPKPLPHELFYKIAKYVFKKSE